MRFAIAAMMGVLIAVRAAVAEMPAPPVNRHLAGSSWPIFHGNNYATACALGTKAVDPDEFETVDNLTHRRLGAGQVSPWTVLRAPTAGGDQVVLTTPMNGVAKYAITNGRLRPVDFLRLERKLMDFDWGILLLADGSAVVTERMHNRFAVIGDRDPADPARSPLAVLRRMPVDSAKYGALTAHFSLAYDGTLIALTSKPALIALDPADGRVLADHTIDAAGQALHNSFPIDERGRVYLLGQRAMVAIDWDGRQFREGWRSPYNMRGPGYEHVREDQRQGLEALKVARGLPGTGSGTTPTLMGTPEEGIVVVVDGHSPRNNLVAFWRGEIPADWKALPDPNRPGQMLDRRVAGVLALPHSTPEGKGFSAENSPAVLGDAVVIAQWAGFKPEADSPGGVQRVDWDRNQRRLKLVWANADVHVNGVPTIARGPAGPRVVGMGREGNRYVYSVLDLETGQRVTRIDLGSSDEVLDQGNNHAIAADGSIIYGGRGKLVRVYRSR